MTRTIHTVAVAATVVLAAFAGVTIGSAAVTTSATNGTTATTATNDTTTATTTPTTTTASNGTAAEVSFPDQRISGERVVVESVTLPDGGFAVVYNQSGSRLGYSDYLSNGTHRGVNVSLNESVEEPQVLVVELFRDAGNRTFDPSANNTTYATANGQNVSDVAYVYFEERNRSDAATTTAGTQTTTDAGATTGDAGATDGAGTTGDEAAETTGKSSGTIPGFSPIAAVVAIVGAMLVGLRRS